MINISKKIIIVCFFFYLPFQSNAWGVLGHRIVGQIADSYLTPTAKKAISKILGNESIAMATNWADFIKSDTTMKYLSPWHYVDINGGLSYPEFQSYLKNDTIVDAYTQLNFLKAVADGIEQFTSVSTMQTYRLGTPNNVTKNRNMLEKADIIDVTKDSIDFLDPAFELWFKKYFLKRTITL